MSAYNASITASHVLLCRQAHFAAFVSLDMCTVQRLKLVSNALLVVRIVKLIKSTNARSAGMAFKAFFQTISSHLASLAQPNAKAV
jgi:hypothetical protein